METNSTISIPGEFSLEKDNVQKESYGLYPNLFELDGKNKSYATMFNNNGISADVMTIYYINSDGAEEKLIEIYRENTMLDMTVKDAQGNIVDDGYDYPYLYFHMGIREKYNTDTFKAALVNVEIVATKDQSDYPLDPKSVITWLKGDGK